MPSYFQNKQKYISQLAGFEPTRAEPIGFQVQRLNHSAKSARSGVSNDNRTKITNIYSNIKICPASCRSAPRAASRTTHPAAPPPPITCRTRCAHRLSCSHDTRACDHTARSSGLAVRWYTEGPARARIGVTPAAAGVARGRALVVVLSRLRHGDDEISRRVTPSASRSRRAAPASRGTTNGSTVTCGLSSTTSAPTTCVAQARRFRTSLREVALTVRDDDCHLALLRCGLAATSCFCSPGQRAPLKPVPVCRTRHPGERRGFVVRGARSSSNVS